MLKAPRGDLCYHGAVNILITGTSGSGKSTIGKLLKERGYNFIEADSDKYNGTSIAYYRNKKSGEGINMPWPPPKNWADENDWVWRPQVIQELLAANSDKANIVSGDSRNKQEAYHLFDKIFVLSTDDKTLYDRLQKRQGNDFGKDPDEYAWVVKENKTIATDLAKAGATVIDTTKPTEEVVNQIIGHINKMKRL